MTPPIQFSTNVLNTPVKQGRGILYLLQQKSRPLVERSIRSVQAVHPELPIHVQPVAENAVTVDKQLLPTLTPFDETLLLDADTVVLDRLDFGFDMAARDGLACCISECPFPGTNPPIPRDDQVQYSSSVLFFTPAAADVFERWSLLERQGIPPTLLYDPGRSLGVDSPADYQSFSQAIAQRQIDRPPPFVLPLNWNFRPRWQRFYYGPLKIWRDIAAPTDDLLAWNREQSMPGAVIHHQTIVI